jgi:hypothetical protein
MGNSSIISVRIAYGINNLFPSLKTLAIPCARRVNCSDEVRDNWMKNPTLTTKQKQMKSSSTSICV